MVELDWSALASLTAGTDLGEALAHAPAQGLACLAAALHDALFGSAAAAARRRAELPHITDEGRVAPRPRAAPPSMPAFTLCSAVRAEQIGRLVTVRGTVVRCTPVRPLVTSMQFACGKCGQVRAAAQAAAQRAAGCSGQSPAAPPGCRAAERHRRGLSPRNRARSPPNKP